MLCFWAILVHLFVFIICPSSHWVVWDLGILLWSSHQLPVCFHCNGLAGISNVLPSGLNIDSVAGLGVVAPVTPKIAAKPGVKSLLFLPSSSMSQNLNFHAWRSTWELKELVVPLSRAASDVPVAKSRARFSVPILADPSAAFGRVSPFPLFSIIFFTWLWGHHTFLPLSLSSLPWRRFPNLTSSSLHSWPELLRPNP